MQDHVFAKRVAEFDHCRMSAAENKRTITSSNLKFIGLLFRHWYHARRWRVYRRSGKSGLWFRPRYSRFAPSLMTYDLSFFHSNCLLGIQDRLFFAGPIPPPV